MNLKRILRDSAILAPFFMLASGAVAFAGSGNCSPMPPDPTNIFGAAGVNVVTLDCHLVETLGSLASLYVSMMNGMVVIAMLLFTFVSARHVIRALRHSHNAGTGAVGNEAADKGDDTFGIVIDAIKNVLESGVITLIILLVIINGANFMLQVASGGGGLFSMNDHGAVADLMGPLGGITVRVQTWLSLGVILLGAVIAVWKGLKVLKEDTFDAYGDRAAYGTGGGVGGASEFKKIQTLVKELGMIALLTVFAFMVIKWGPDFIVTLLSGTQSVIQVSGISLGG